jgi:hypothetical protein
LKYPLSAAFRKVQMSNRTKVLRTLVVLGIVACIAGAGVFSAFSSQTDNPGNSVTSGTVVLSDNDAGSALYTLTNAKPGDSQTSCIKVTYSGSLDSSVRIYTPSTVGALGTSVNLKIEPGTQASPSFPGCTNFTPDAGAALFEGTLADFAAEHGSFANGIADNPGTVATKWATGDAVVYRVTATLATNAPDSAQGQSTGSHIIRWEAQNQSASGRHLARGALATGSATANARARLPSDPAPDRQRRRLGRGRGGGGADPRDRAAACLRRPPAHGADRQHGTDDRGW